MNDATSPKIAAPTMSSKHWASKGGYPHRQRRAGGNTARAVTRTARTAPSLGRIATKRGWRPAVYKKDARLRREAAAARMVGGAQ